MENMLRDLWIDQTVFMELHHRFIDPICEKHGLNRVEFSILFFLSKYPHLNRAADIVKYKGFSKSYVSLSIKSLSDRHLLEGRKSENDKKNIYLSLLPDADPIILEGMKAQKDYCAVLCDGLTPQEIATLVTCSHKVTDNVKQAINEPNQIKKKHPKKG